MKCSKCDKKVYYKNLCRNHYRKYFLRKFKTYLRMTGLINYGDKVRIVGINKDVLKKVLEILGKKISVKFTMKGRKINSFSIEYYCVKGLKYFLKGEKFSEKSPIECFTQDEINHFAEMEGLGTKELRFKKKDALIYNMMKNLENNRPGIFYSTKKMLDEVMNE